VGHRVAHNQNLLKQGDVFGAGQIVAQGGLQVAHDLFELGTLLFVEDLVDGLAATKGFGL
jgi:hypothetical protein